MVQGEGKGMDQMQIMVASYTLSIRFDCEGCPGGTLVRLPDEIEAHFSSRDCLLHLLEGMLGRRAWQSCRGEIEAQLVDLLG